MLTTPAALGDDPAERREDQRGREGQAGGDHRRPGENLAHIASGSGWSSPAPAESRSVRHRSRRRRAGDAWGPRRPPTPNSAAAIPSTIDGTGVRTRIGGSVRIQAIAPIATEAIPTRLISAELALAMAGVGVTVVIGRAPGGARRRRPAPDHRVRAPRPAVGSGLPSPSFRGSPSSLIAIRSVETSSTIEALDHQRELRREFRVDRGQIEVVGGGPV